MLFVEFKLFHVSVTVVIRMSSCNDIYVKAIVLSC